MTKHTVRSFDDDLKQLRTLIIDMGAAVGTQLEHAMEAMEARDNKLAQSVLSTDRVVDSFQLRVEDMVVSTIAKRQPVAVDLREIIATLKIATDLERIGDLAKNNAKRILAIGELSHPPSVATSLAILGERVLKQLAQVMKAYAEHDNVLAQEVWSGDEEIDTMQNSLFRELLTYMMEDPRNIGFCAHLLFCAKNLERVGDHATNIAENVHFIVTGEMISGERPKGASAVEIVDMGADRS